MLHAVGVGWEALVFGPFVMPQDVTKFAPHIVIATRRIDVTVFATIGFVRGNGRMLIAHTVGTLTSGKINTSLVGQQCDLAIEHPDVNFLPLSGLIAGHQRQQNTLKAHHPGHDIRL